MEIFREVEQDEKVIDRIAAAQREELEQEIPDYLMRQAAEVAERENTTVDSFISIALSSQVTAWQVRDTVEQRATRGASSDIGAILASVPDASPGRREIETDSECDAVHRSCPISASSSAPSATPRFASSNSQKPYRPNSASLRGKLSRRTEELGCESRDQANKA